MDKDALLKFIADGAGYRTKVEIAKQFSNADPEILAMNLEYLTTRNKVRKVKVASSGGETELYYVPA